MYVKIMSRIIAVIAMAAVVGCELAASPDPVRGRVLLEGRDTPISNVAITLNSPKVGADAVTVFSDENGEFRFPESIRAVEQTYITVRKVGFEVADSSKGRNGERINVGEGGVTRVYLDRKRDIAEQVPASYWMGTAPESSAKHLVNLQCSGCHQFPSQKILNYGRLIEKVRMQAGGDAKAKEMWAEQVRKEGWRAAIKYMRAKAYDIYPEGSEVDIKNVPWDIVQGEQFTLFNEHQSETIASFLASEFPTNTRGISSESYEVGAPYADLRNVVIHEYQLPNTSLVREAVVLKDNPHIWGADIEKNRIVKIHPGTGEQHWFDVPYEGATGPHTLVGDGDGMLWVSMMDNDQLARFDPAASEWKLWTLRPDNMEAKKILGGQATVHDMAYDYRGELARDQEGKIWATLVGINHMASVSPDSDRVEFFPAVDVKGHSPISTSLYGAVMGNQGECVWFSQLNGYFGCFNTKTKTSEHLVAFSEGTGPRRMAIQKNGVVWVPLYGAGQILKYNSITKQKIATYDLPDRRAAPYAVAWDETRQRLWVTTTNADVIYRFYPNEERFSVYPLPRKQGYLRQLSIDHDTGNLIGSYSNIPAGAGPSMAIMIEVGAE